MGSDMLLKWAAILSAFVAASFGSVPPAERSDFSMYDNQFNRVGDTELDDEVTDCAVVEHQFRKGYIRLREYLERKRGCGRQGKLKNIEGIAKSTEDDVNIDNIAEIAKSTTEDYHFTPSQIPAVKKAPKPKTIPQAIKIYQPNKMANVPRRYPMPAQAHLMPVQPVLQTTVQRNKAARPSLNDYQRESQNLALSFKSNPSFTAIPSSVEGQNSEAQFTSTLGGDQYTRLASNDGKGAVNPRKPEHDLLQTFYPNTLQDRSHEPNSVAVGQPLYIQKARVQPPAARAQNKVSNFLTNAMNNFDKVPASNSAITNKINQASPKPQLYNKPSANLNLKNSPDENIDDPHADMRDPERDDNSGSIDAKPPQQPGIDDQHPAGQATNNNKPVSNTLNRFEKPFVTGNPTSVNQPQNTLTQNIATQSAVDKVQPSQPSINLDVLKNKILHTTNATFLRRMLALIQKITHHKDFHKLQAPARSFVTQANTAVQALNKAYNERVSSSPVTMGIDYPLTKKSAVQRFNQAYNVNQRMSAAPVNLGTVNRLYENNYKKSIVQALNNQPYNKRISAATLVNPAVRNRFYGNNDYSLTKKFQIARNPYYQNYYQYRQPYYSNLQRMQYGLYNGNVP